MSNIEFYDLPNIGVLKSRLPSNLLSKILNECLNVSLKNGNIRTGLTGSGVPNHYLTSKVIEEELQNYMGNLVNSYCERYPHILTNILTKDCNLIFDTPWINLQKKHEFLPNHKHDGVLSYSIWVKIPYDVEKEINWKKLKFGNQKFYSFEFSYTDILGLIRQHSLNISKEDEGMVHLFPSQLIHCVYPFYTGEEDRISISGNIKYKVD